MRFRSKVFFSIAGLFSLALPLPSPAGPAEFPEIGWTSSFAPAARDVRIKKIPVSQESSARREFRERVELFERYLAKQIDPYTGAASTDSRCRRAKALTVRPGQLSQSMVLMVSPALAIDCYGRSADRRVNHKQFLYCAKSKSLFEIDFYHGLDENPRVPEARCL